MEPGQEIIVRDNRTNIKLFGGYIKDVTRRFIDKNRYVEFCGTQDYSKLIANVVDGVTADYTAGANTEKEILTALFASYCSTISVGSHVITGNATAINFENSSLRRAIDELAAVEGRKWYVDSDKRLHYFASTGETAPFGLSDSPNQTTTFDYGNLEYTIDENGDITGTLKCWMGGLYAGMAVAITCAKVGWAAQSYIITEVDTRLISGSLSNTDIIAEYTVSFGTILKSQISNEIIRSGRVITTARIADLAVTNAKIEDCSISKLTAGDISVTGTLISGGKFQTAVSPNPRIEISDTLIAGYSDATTKQFYLQASNGKAYAGAGAVIIDANGITCSGSAATNWVLITGTSGAGVVKWQDTVASKECTINMSVFGNLQVHSNTGSCINLDTLGSDPAGLAYCIKLGSRYIVLPQHTADAPNVEGNCYYDTTNHLLKIYNGTAWKTVTWT